MLLESWIVQEGYLGSVGPTLHLLLFQHIACGNLGLKLKIAQTIILQDTKHIPFFDHQLTLISLPSIPYLSVLHQLQLIKRQLIQFNHKIHMSNSNYNQQGASAYLINPYGKPISRLVRTKDTQQESSVVTKTSQSVITHPSLLVRKGRNEQPVNQTQKLMPSRVSELSSNIVFQDVDSPSKSISRTSAKQQQGNRDKEVKTPVIGLIGNAFMGATTKYSKLPYDQITTPTKNILPQQTNTPKNIEAESNIHTKFSRRREAQPTKIQKQNELTLDFNSLKAESKEEAWTDRSFNQSNRKIERKTDRNRRQLKFGQKRQPKQEIETQTLVQLGEQSRVVGNNSKLTQVSQQINKETQPMQSHVVKPKPYEPIKRSNAETTQIQTINNISQSRPVNNYRTNKVEQSTQPVQQYKSVPQAVGRQQIIKSQLKTQPVMTNFVKKSALVGYAIKRLLFIQLASSFRQLKLINYQEKIKTTKQSWLLSQAVVFISHNKQAGFLRWSFDLLKYKFSQKYVVQMKNELIYKEPNRVQIALSFFEKIYQSKLQNVWRKLKNKQFWFKQQIQSVNVLDQTNKKKTMQLQKIALLALANTSKTKTILLTTLNMIVSNFNKYKAGLAFIKLQAAAKPKLQKNTPHKKANLTLIKESITLKQQQQTNSPIKTNVVLIEKAQKLKAIVNSVRDNLSIINKKLKEAEQQSTQQKQEFQYKVVNLKQTNQQIESELQNKKGRISLIQKQLSNINSKVQTNAIEDQLQINTQDNYLQKLAKVYMENYKNKEELVTTTEVLEEYHLTSDNCSKACLQWQLLADNIQLKHLIAAYEQHVGPVEFKARKMALAQQQVAAKLVRSYIKEQYFWQWLHLTAQSLECK